MGLALPDPVVKRVANSFLWKRFIKSLYIVVTTLFVATLTLLTAPLLAQEPVTPPAATPDAGAGLQLFAERCAACHGPLGQGDGEMAAQLPRPPTALGSADYARQAVPANMFHVITNGILDAGMPPFGPGNSDPLDEQQRWDLVAAVYSLGTSPALIEDGQMIYEENCQACHAQDGSGVDGVLDLRAQDYWLERSNEDIFLALSQNAIPEHETLALDEEALLAATTYARTFSYEYANPLAAFEPLESAVITGTVTNESSGRPLQAGVPAVLSAFTADFEPSLTMTTTLNSAGQYEFELTMAPPDLVYVVTVQHQGISYGSDFGRLERDDPTLNLDVPVFEPSTDPSTVAIEQLHVILQFGEGQVQVSELYQFSQNASTVFVGQTGDADEGTVRIALPGGASEPEFDRSFGGMESFFPAETVIPTDGGWADTVPLRPGPASLSLLVRYAMPYDGGLTINHPVHYAVSNVNLVLPDAGVELAGDGWQEGQPQVMGEAGVFLNYTQSGVAAGQEVSFSLQGEPRQVSPSPAATTPLRDQSSDLLIGGGVLLLALALGAFTLRQWRQNQDEEHLQESQVTIPGEERAAPDKQAVRRQELLNAIAALDDAYEAGDLPAAEYGEQRQALKEELVAIWDA